MAPISVLSVFPSIEMLLSLGVMRFGLSSVFSASGFSVCNVMHFPSPKVTDFFKPLNSRLIGCAFSDTLATSYALACALRNLEYDLIICGRQAIDGDTAQVGPQVAEKLNLPQVTYAESIDKCENGRLTIKRRLERGVEVVECPMPCVVTVNGSAAVCRPRNARFVMKYKYAKAAQEMQDAGEDYMQLLNERPYLKLTEWSVNDITCEAQELGLSGSPTKVKNIESVVFQAKEAKVLTPADADIDAMMKELITNHTIG